MPHHRIRMQTLDTGTDEPVSRADLVKGYQIAKGNKADVVLVAG